MVNKLSSTTERIFNETKNLWHSILDESQSIETFDSSVLKNFPLLDIANSTQSTFAIYDFRELKPIFITENVKEIIGFSREEYLKEGGRLLFSRLHPSHSNFPLAVSQYLEKVLKNIQPHEKQNVFGTVCGISIEHPEKGYIKILMQQYYMDCEYNNIPPRVLSTMRDVSHLLKDDFYWMRLTHGVSNNLVTVYHNKDEKVGNLTDIISVREKEVLLLIEKGLETDEIAQTLSISRNTVNNHRQNMLNRLGARDTTALIELARICRLI
jgi:DNA-binding CsgD family transcriptional regulator